MPPLWDARYTPEHAQIIQSKARKFLRRSFTEHEIQDLVQEAEINGYQQLPRYRPERGTLAAFLGIATKNFLLNQIAIRKALKRDDRRNVALEQAPDHALAAMQYSKRIIEQVDVSSAVARMPAVLQQVWQLQKDGYEEKEMETILGRTRSQVRTLIKQLRQFLLDAHLDPFSDE